MKDKLYKEYDKFHQGCTTSEIKYVTGSYVYEYHCPICKSVGNDDGRNLRKTTTMSLMEFKHDCPFCGEVSVIFCKRHKKHPRHKRGKGLF